MLNTNTLAADFLTLVDAMIADAQYGVAARGPYREFLVQWSAVQTGAGNTTRDEDNRMIMAIQALFTGNDLYA